MFKAHIIPLTLITGFLLVSLPIDSFASNPKTTYKTNSPNQHSKPIMIAFNHRGKKGRMMKREAKAPYEYFEAKGSANRR